MPFNALGLSAPLLRALADAGYKTPTPIQAAAIPAILEGRDVLGNAQTGTGKTAAFALPIIHRLHQHPAPRSGKSGAGPILPRALLLVPTRELAAQIGESFAAYGKHAGLSYTTIFGGVSQFHQVRALHRGVDVLIATPGRLEDLMQQRLVTLSAISVLVLDEADRMLDMGFIRPIQRITAALPRPRQTLLFSATMPREIMHLADALLQNPVKVAVSPVASAAPLIQQQLYHVPFRLKQGLLEHLLPSTQRAIVFTKTKHGADRVCRRLHVAGFAAVAIHGNKAQNYRLRALADFRSGKCPILVATDVAARGVDIDEVSHVFNFDLPMEPEAYVHRIGRTGRAGASGIAISFCDPAESDLLRQIQRLVGKSIPVQQLPDLPEPAPQPRHPHSSDHHGASTSSHRSDRHRSSSQSSHPRSGSPRASRDQAPHGAPRSRAPHSAPRSAPRSQDAAPASPRAAQRPGVFSRRPPKRGRR